MKGEDDACHGASNRGLDQHWMEDWEDGMKGGCLLRGEMTGRKHKGGGGEWRKVEKGKSIDNWAWLRGRVGPRLVPKIFSTVSVTSNFSTHA